MGWRGGVVRGGFCLQDSRCIPGGLFQITNCIANHGLTGIPLSICLPPPASLYSSFFHGQNIHVGWGGILLCFIFKGIVSQDFRGHPAIPAVAHLIFYYRKMRYNIEWHMQMKRTKTLGKSRRQPNYIYAIINGFYTV